MSGTAEVVGLFLGVYTIGLAGGLALAFFVLPFTVVKRCSEVPL